MTIKGKPINQSVVHTLLYFGGMISPSVSLFSKVIVYHAADVELCARL